MADTGWKSFGLAGNINTGTIAWISPGSAIIDNTDEATLEFLTSTTGPTDRLRLLANLFSVPAGATIDGVELQGRGGETLGLGVDITIQLVYNGTPIGNTKQEELPDNVNFAGSWGPVGGPSDVWGASLTPAIVNDNTFGVDFYYPSSIGQATDLGIEYAEMKVYYTEGGGSEQKCSGLKLCLGLGL